MGKKRPRAKTKTVLKPMNKIKQLAGMPKTKKLKNLNKNHPNIHLCVAIVFPDVISFSMFANAMKVLNACNINCLFMSEEH